MLIGLVSNPLPLISMVDHCAVIWLDCVCPLHLHGRVSYAFFPRVHAPDVCLFSLGEGCSHVAALIFKVGCVVRLGYTSQVCVGNSTFTSKVSVMFTVLSLDSHL